MGLISDTFLTKKIRKGDEKAFEILFDRYHKQMFFLAKKYVKDQELAEDAVQDTFVKLWYKRKDLDPSRSIKSFLFTILKHHLLNMIRKEKSRIFSQFEGQEESMSASERTEDEVIYADYKKIVERGLEELSEGKRVVFEMKVYEGLSNEQIAEKLLVTIHTVKSHYYQGSKFIRTYLKKHADIES